jgi:hypothetical protein
LQIQKIQIVVNIDHAELHHQIHGKHVANHSSSTETQEHVTLLKEHHAHHSVMVHHQDVQQVQTETSQVIIATRSFCASMVKFLEHLLVELDCSLMQLKDNVFRILLVFVQEHLKSKELRQ